MTYGLFIYYGMINALYKGNMKTHTNKKENNMTHKEASGIVMEICKPIGNDVNCGNCPYFHKCELDRIYGRAQRYEMLASFINPLNK